MGVLIPQIWEDALVASYLSKANALHRSLQQANMEEWIRKYAQGELDYVFVLLQRLGYRAVLRDGVYQLEE